MLRTRYLIAAGDVFVSIPSNEHMRIELTHSIAQALKFVTYERAEQVALSLHSKLDQTPTVVSQEIPY
jgi:hypothetical protein